MQLFALPAHIEGLIFDIDKTLYDDPAYAELQISMLVDRLAAEWGKSSEETQTVVDEWRDRYALEHAGEQQSLGNTFVGLGVPIETSVRWREQLVHPHDHLTADPRLAKAMRSLASRFRLIAVTNNPRSVGVESLAALGIDRQICDVVGLDTTWKSKPSTAPFEEAARRLQCESERIVSVGDRYDVDIAPALSIGMGGILVDEVADVYRLADVLVRSGSLDEL